MYIKTKNNYSNNNIPTPPVLKMNWCSLECCKRP